MSAHLAEKSNPTAHVSRATVSQALTNLLLAENDVRAVDKLEFSPAKNRWLYLIETPFEAYPRFVVGWTDEIADEVQFVSQHGAHWSALASFYRTIEKAKEVAL